MNIATQQKEQSVHPQPVNSERPHVSPRVNVVENKDGYSLEAEMPGVGKDGLDISVEENVLTITGRRPAEPVANLLYRESRPADYRRVFELAPSIDSQKISAKIEQGILTLTLPKAERVKPRRIAVN